MLKRISVIFSIFLFSYCDSPQDFPYVSYVNLPPKKTQLTEKELKSWYRKDIEDDTIPGISLEKAYELLLKNKKGGDVVVAVIDMVIDIRHQDLQHQIWTNDKEIPGNNVDDDNNGYVDDIHGWNFLGNHKGENIQFVNYEYTRILKKYDRIFKNKEIGDIPLEEKSAFLEYLRAKNRHKERMEFAIEDKRNGDLLYNNYYQAKKELAPYFPSGNYTLEKLDSLDKRIAENSALKEPISLLSDCLKYDLTEKYINDYKLKADERLNKLLNVSYNDREILGDDPSDISDRRYGNNRVNNNTAFFDHGTTVAGIIAATCSDSIWIKGFSDDIKIMPLCISAYGDEHDKDIALAIKYAVDNGAKVINMSFGKEFSLHKDWVDDALKYAEQKNVLIVTSAGNDGYDLDGGESANYPDDNDSNGKEIAQNFIKVGESGFELNEELRSPSSNYGKKSVDIFAPGVKIYTTTAEQEKYKFVDGTSASAAIVSGVAALIFSYFPDLSASQIKRIIMESGVSYDIECRVQGAENNEIKQSFNKFSKSGKIINAYNALLMAEKKSNNKKLTSEESLYKDVYITQKNKAVYKIQASECNIFFKNSFIFT